MSRVSPGSVSVAPDDGGAARARARGSRLLVVGIAAGALAVVIAIVAPQHDGPESVPEQVTAANIEACNHRDARAVSDLTCLWPPAFTPPNVVEKQFSSDPAGVPHVSDYSVIDTEPDRLPAATWSSSACGTSGTAKAGHGRRPSTSGSTTPRTRAWPA